jgi:hypothetical protein
VSITFSSRRSSMPLFRQPAAPVRNRRRPFRPSLEATVLSWDGLRNCFFGVPHLRGLPRSSHQLFFGEVRGPLPIHEIA